MNNNPDRNLILAAAELARSNPQKWDEFLTAMSEYSAKAMDTLVSSGPENLKVAQGRAQMSRDLKALLEGAVKSADRITSRQT